MNDRFKVGGFHGFGDLGRYSILRPFRGSSTAQAVH